MELKDSRTASDGRFAIVVSRFNEEVTEGLLSGARRALAEGAVRQDAVTVVRVPGAFELPVTAQRLAESRRFDAIICIGCVIKGETMHFEYIASAVSNGIMQASVASGVPMAFGVLTVLTDEQAIERAADNVGNKGWEAGCAAIEMAALFRELPVGGDS